MQSEVVVQSDFLYSLGFVRSEGLGFRSEIIFLNYFRLLLTIFDVCDTIIITRIYLYIKNFLIEV